VIGQVGYMFLGVGLGLYFLRRNPALGALGLMGGVFHMLNHSLSKSCLFLGAGAVFYRSGTRSLNALSGLGRRMPLTAACAVMAALAIAGVPPLNGFASKWLMYVTAILGGLNDPLFAVVGIVAMFVSLVTLASFLKYLGGVFLGPPLTREAPSEVPAGMLVPQAALALACVVFGLVPGWPLRFVHRALADAAPEAGLPNLASLLGAGPGLSVSMGGLALAAWAPLALVGGLAILVCLAGLIQRAGGAQVRHVPVWNCGEEHPAELVRYPASSYYQPLKQAFQGIYPTLELKAPRFPLRLRRALDLDAWLYLPMLRFVKGGSAVVSRTHVGVPQVYLLWIVVGAAAAVGILLGMAR
jgi:hydrogenase-4 component B